MQYQEKNFSDKTNFEAVYKSSFFLERNSVSTPIPTQHYHYHNCYELYYLYSGERYYFIKDKTYHVDGGSFVLIKPYEIHSTANFAQCGYDRLLINFQTDYLRDFANFAENSRLFECFENDIHVITLSPRDQLFAEMLMENMDREYHTANSSDESHYLKSSVLQLLLFLNKHRSKENNTTQSYINSTHKMISEIIGYINNNYNKNITLDLISETFYISPYYFSRTFKKVSGMSFTEYLNHVRIKEARKLLHKTNMTITNVAENAGFNSNAHFDRVFKNIVGMSPLAYKKSLGT